MRVNGGGKGEGRKDYKMKGMKEKGDGRKWGRKGRGSAERRGKKGEAMGRKDN